MNIGEEKKEITVVPVEVPDEPVLDPGPETPTPVEPEKEPVGV